MVKKIRIWVDLYEMFESWKYQEEKLKLIDTINEIREYGYEACAG